MKKYILFSVIILSIISCNQKIEFLQSKVRTNLFLIKNPPQKNSFSKLFYKYNSDTKYFLDHEEDPGGFSSEEISMYDDEAKLAVFFISKCENDTTKRYGHLKLYSEWGKHIKTDTIIFKCD